MIGAEASLMALEQARLWTPKSYMTALAGEMEHRGEDSERSLTRLRLVRHQVQSMSDLEELPTWEFSRDGGIPHGVVELGDSVLISRTGGPFAFATGTVAEVSPRFVRVRAR